MPKDILISYEDINAKKDALESLLREEAPMAQVNQFLQDNFRIVFDVNFMLGFKNYEHYEELMQDFDDAIKMELLRPLSRRQCQCFEALFDRFLDATEKMGRFWDFLDDNERSTKKKYLSVAEISALSLMYERALMATA